jgi:hypothetical protein
MDKKEAERLENIRKWQEKEAERIKMELEKLKKGRK